MIWELISRSFEAVTVPGGHSFQLGAVVDQIPHGDGMCQYGYWVLYVPKSIRK